MAKLNAMHKPGEKAPETGTFYCYVCSLRGETSTCDMREGQMFLACPHCLERKVHSPHLIDQLALDELVVLERREGATTIARPGNKEHLRKLLEEEEIGLGSLYYSGALGGAS